MKPLHENPLTRDTEKRIARMTQEVEDFIDCGAEYAELWSDPGINCDVNRCIYKSILEDMGVYGRITVHTRKHVIYAVKHEEEA